MLEANPTALALMNSSGASNENSAQRGFAPPIILQYLQVVIRWKWLIIGIMLAAVTLGLVVTLLATPKFTATSRIEISRAQKNVTNVESIESEESGRDLEFYQTQ